MYALQENIFSQVCYTILCYIYIEQMQVPIHK